MLPSNFYNFCVLMNQINIFKFFYFQFYHSSVRITGMKRHFFCYDLQHFKKFYYLCACFCNCSFCYSMGYDFSSRENWSRFKKIDPPPVKVEKTRRKSNSLFGYWQITSYYIRHSACIFSCNAFFTFPSTDEAFLKNLYKKDAFAV